MTSSDHPHNEHCCGQHRPVVSSVHQTLDEMEFERGVWSAALNGEVDRVSKHIQNHGDVNIVDSSGYCAIHYAARNGHNEVCRLLLQAGACPNSQTRSGKVTPLHRASYCGHLPVVKTLLGRNAQASLTDADGQLPLHKAAEKNHHEVGFELVKNYPQGKEAQDCRGRTPRECLPVNHSDKWEEFLT